MTTETQIGNVCTEANGDEFTVRIEQWTDEEPNAVVIDGKCCLLIFDPGTMEGRGQIRALIARLNEAVTVCATRVEEIYGALKVGDHCGDIRLPMADEKRCPHHATAPNGDVWACSRVRHEDFHHVVINDNYQVIAVRHAADYTVRTS